MGIKESFNSLECEIVHHKVLLYRYMGLLEILKSLQRVVIPNDKPNSTLSGNGTYKPSREQTHIVDSA